MQQRIFIGIPVPDTSGAALLSIAKSAHLKSIHWTPVANHHLTLAFLGTLDDARMGTLINELGKICALQAFELSIVKISRFPDSGGHILAALPTPSSELEALHSTVTHLLATNKFQLPEQPFKPHITLGRFRKPFKGQGEIDYSPPEVVRFLVEGVCLYQSIQSDTGVTYLTKAHYPLSARQNSR